MKEELLLFVQLGNVYFVSLLLLVILFVLFVVHCFVIRLLFRHWLFRHESVLKERDRVLELTCRKFYDSGYYRHRDLYEGLCDSKELRDKHFNDLKKDLFRKIV